MKWPKSAGKTIEECLDATASRLDRRAFDAALHQYLSDQGPKITLDEKELETLFEIADNFLRKRDAADAMKNAGVTLDWKKRAQLMKRLTRRLGPVREGLKADPGKEFPLTKLLVKSIRSKVGAILRELDSIVELQRAEKSLFATLRHSSESVSEYVWDLEAFLTFALPRLRAQDRNLVIAGALLAAGLRPDDPDKDASGGIPMARSRALREMMGEELVFSWLNKWTPRADTHILSGHLKPIENGIDRQAAPPSVPNHQRPRK